MKAIRRNFFLACLISTFCFFGALGRGPAGGHSHHVIVVKRTPAQEAEATKETLALLAVAGITWALCFWRCAVINRKHNEQRFYQARFNEYMRNNLSANKR